VVTESRQSILLVGNGVLAESLAQHLNVPDVELVRTQRERAREIAQVVVPDLAVLVGDAAEEHGAPWIDQLGADAPPIVVVCAPKALMPRPQLPPRAAILTPGGGVAECARRLRAVLQRVAAGRLARVGMQQLVDETAQRVAGAPLRAPAISFKPNAAGPAGRAGTSPKAAPPMAPAAAGELSRTLAESASNAAVASSGTASQRDAGAAPKPASAAKPEPPRVQPGRTAGGFRATREIAVAPPFEPETDVQPMAADDRPTTAPAHDVELDARDQPAPEAAGKRRHHTLLGHAPLVSVPAAPPASAESSWGGDSVTAINPAVTGQLLLELESVRSVPAPAARPPEAEQALHTSAVPEAAAAARIQAATRDPQGEPYSAPQRPLQQSSRAHAKEWSERPTTDATALPRPSLASHMQPALSLAMFADDTRSQRAEPEALETSVRPAQATPVAVSLPTPAEGGRILASPKLRAALYVGLAAACSLLALHFASERAPEAGPAVTAVGALEQAAPAEVMPRPAAESAPGAAAMAAPAVPVAPAPAQPGATALPPAEAPAEQGTLTDAGEARTARERPRVTRRQRARARRLVTSGTALIRRGRLDRAEAAFERALEAWPEYSRALAGMARVHIKRKEGPEAVRWAERLVARVPKRAQYQLLLGDAAALSGDLTAAQAAWKRAARYGSPSARARLRKSLRTAPALAPAQAAHGGE